jgi:hypothetical protein
VRNRPMSDDTPGMSRISRDQLEKELRHDLVLSKPAK